jgi:hypothetical protein
MTMLWSSTCERQTSTGANENILFEWLAAAARKCAMSDEFLRCSNGDFDIKIDIDEFMFGFQWLFKSKDQPLPDYLLASALWSVFLERANRLPPPIGVTTDV